MRFRGSPSSLLLLNASSWSLRAASWNKNIALPHPKHYATENSKQDDSKPSWIHIAALGFSSWIHSHRSTVAPQPAQGSTGGTKLWVHYTALGLQRDASQDQIKRSYYELSKLHHPDVSQDPSSPEIFRKVTEAYTVLGKKKTRRKYDQNEQLHSALITGLRDQWSGQPPSSSPRPLDPTYWNPIKLGSSTFYRPPAGYWTAMNKLMRDREKEREKEKLQAQATSSSPQKPTPSHDRPKGHETQIRFSEVRLKLFLACFSTVFTLVIMGQGVEELLAYARASLVRLLQENESDGSAGRIEDPTSQATDASPDG
ncbi:hypothetical protein DEU56DRAFT_941653 [Suillus clintonianus]|uniref:uncharacterized protein n=1 Tax=Suillus clintonianus TaxID=1904413 RepID=UPI001B88135F|nr:uncharacterized protein DEU56DRAFT_941653 [Suillus clintonianus]KAG2140657.1 hypothetical protein DEU56DRAFT_941653 [Suillus clintonianus]